MYVPKHEANICKLEVAMAGQRAGLRYINSEMKIPGFCYHPPECDRLMRERLTEAPKLTFTEDT